MTTPREAMWLLASSVIDPDHLDEVPVLAKALCGEKGERCNHPVASLYSTRLGPVLLAFVRNEEHDTATFSPMVRREFTRSRDQRLTMRSEVDVVAARLGEFDGWHPSIPQVVCWEHGELPFDRDSFVERGRRHRARRKSSAPLVVMVHRRRDPER